MPKLHLGCLKTPQKRAIAVLRIYAVMAWPGDHQRQEQYIASELAELMAKFEEQIQVSGDPLFKLKIAHKARIATRSDFEEQFFIPHGGYGAVAQAPGTERLEKNFMAPVQKWLVPSIILTATARISKHHPEIKGGGSVNKGVFLIENIAKRVPDNALPKTASLIRKIWTDFKPVAHLCAGWMLTNFATNKMTGTNAKEKDDLRLFLSASKWFEDFATTYVPHGRGSPLVSPAEIYEIPETADGIMPQDIIIEPLSDFELEIINEYVAPTPYA